MKPYGGRRAASWQESSAGRKKSTNTRWPADNVKIERAAARRRVKRVERQAARRAIRAETAE